MAVKFNFKRNNLFTIACIIFMMCAFSFSAAAQRIKLRGQINPTCTTTVTNAKFADIYADGNIAVMGTYGCTGVFIIDVSNPSNPVVASRYNPGNNLQFLEAIVIGNRGYFGSGNGGGVHIVDLTNPASPVLLGIVNSANGTGYNSIHEMMIRGNYLLENFNGTSTRPLKIINISNPAAATLKWTFLNTPQEEAIWVHAYHIRGNRLFTSGWGNGSNRGKTSIYDISDLDNQPPQLLGSIEDTSSTTAGNSMHSNWSSEDGNYLYSCRETGNGNADLRVYDIHNPAVPLLIKKITMAQLGITAISPHNPVVMGNKLYVSWYQAGLVLFDISDPADPKMIGQYDTWPQEFNPDANLMQRKLDEEPWDMICANFGRGKNLVAGFDGDWAVFPFLGENKVLIGDLATGLYIVDVSVKNRVSDFDGDGKTDFSKFTPSTGVWEIENSSTQADATTPFGLNGDKLAAGDYDGDGKSDIGLWRPSDGTWYSLNSSNGVFRANQFGLTEDIPVPGDFDGDGKTDLAVWRPSNGVWYMFQSTQGVRIMSWGMTGDKPLVGDYDGDGKSDPVIYRGGSWYIWQSSTNAPAGAYFGLADDRPLAGDFDGDAKSDYAVYRPSTGTWYIFKSTINNFTAVTFGLPTDLPIPADYDGDGKADFAVYRPSDGNWHILQSSNSGYSVKNFGSGNDIPSPSSVNP
jgi:hypothetical protein